MTNNFLEKIPIKKRILALFVLLSIIFIISIGVGYGAPARTYIGDNKIYSSGVFGFTVKKTDRSGNNESIIGSRNINATWNTTPTWKQAQDNSRQINLSVSDGNGGVTLGAAHVNTSKTLTLNDSAYIDGGVHNTSDNYHYIMPTAKVTIPAGYQYQKLTGVNPSIFGISEDVMPARVVKTPIAFKNASASNRTCDFKLCHNVATYGLKTSNQYRYTGIYAIITFIPTQYTIAYNLDGGQFGDNHPTTATYDSTFIVNNPTRFGYDFAGWNISGMDADNVTHTYGSTTGTGENTTGRKETSFKNLKGTAGTATFTADWIPHTGTISFRANGGDGSMDDQDYIYNTTETIAKNEFVNRGYIFRGWNTERDGSGTAYADEADIKTAFPDDNTHITLYAQWEDKGRFGDFSIDGDTAVNGYQFEKVNTQEDTLKVTASLKNDQFYSIFGLDDESQFVTKEDGNELYTPSYEITKGDNYAIAPKDEGDESSALSTACETLYENMEYLFTNVKSPPKTKGLKVIKKVTGDKVTSEDKTRAFTFSYDITGLSPSGEYKLVKPSDTDGEENETLLTASSSGRISGTTTITHDGYFTITGLPEGAKYNITELTNTSSISSWPYKSNYEVTNGGEDENGDPTVNSKTSFGVTQLPNGSNTIYGLSINQNGEKNDKGLGVETLHDDIEYTFKNAKADDHNITLKKQVNIDNNENVTPPGNEDFNFTMHFSNLMPNTLYSATPAAYNFTTDENGKADVDVILKAKNQVVFKNIPGDVEYKAEEKGSKYTADVKVYTSGTSPIYETFGMYGQGVSVNNQESRMSGDEQSENEIGLDANQTLLFTNSKDTSNDLTIRKETSGKGAKSTDTFNFTADFTGLAIKTYNVIRYTYDENDSLTATENLTFNAQSSTGTYNFTLKNNQKLTIIGLPDTSTYKITEAGSEGYIPSFVVNGMSVEEDDEDSDYSSKEGEEGKSLATDVYDLPVDEEVLFTNIKDTKPPEKTVSDNDNIKWDGTGPEKNVEENTVPDRNSSWEYKIRQKIYPGYNSFEFKDDLPDNVVFNSFPNFNPSTDITIKWIKSNNSTVTETLSAGDDPDDNTDYKSAHFNMLIDATSVYLQSKDASFINEGGTFEITLKAKVNPNSDMNDFKESKQIYRKNERLIFNNQAETTLDDNDYESNLVQTFIPLSMTLTVSKVVKGDNTDTSEQFNFTAELSNLEANKTYTYNNEAKSFTTNSNGSATVNFKLRDKEYISFDTLPSGTRYKITEAASDYIPSYKVTRGSERVNTSEQALRSINQSLSTSNETLSAATEFQFTNSKSMHTVTVNKKVKGNLGDLTKEFEFTASFTGLAENMNYGDFTSNSNGKGICSFKLKSGESKIFENIPESATVNVTEAASNHIASVKVTNPDTIANKVNTNKEESLSTGNINITKDTTVAFENTRNLESITSASTTSFVIVLIALISILLFISLKRRKRHEM